MIESKLKQVIKDTETLNKVMNIYDEELVKILEQALLRAQSKETLEVLWNLTKRIGKM